ncbi:hypothetical protein COT94_00090 [Candidatus Falkowbacteria bacterium CG10_big_fil_rev_8_21_14_0_10_37_14]|uniref:Uncharacterized protein n=1 Tax=Candidatus Falkowbacteria bacterium CG10_big_fil_rev_8_21_14_0_10_37_14 TaxID=1974561 RepID=A0A2M6WUN3_9BACT|nr:MAG: hypothetical protein COT94_00090 [Candidatus Falkowbacteria bacterium CG10_big_fil_rev_8_21_14_0_10_37_14]
MKAATKKTKVVSSGRDYTKYEFNGNVYGKGRLVLAVINNFVTQNPNVSLTMMKTIFDKNIVSISKKDKESKRRFFTKELIKIGNKKNIMVTNQWSKDNISEFIKFVRKNLKENIVVC